MYFYYISNFLIIYKMKDDKKESGEELIDIDEKGNPMKK